MKICIIGAGIFGLYIAEQLSKNFKVKIFEKSSSIMSAASINNQNRLHLGYHYPRDDITAKQCIEGFNLFKKKFHPFIFEKFKNYYFIAKKNSKINFKSYEEFCLRNNLEFNLIGNDDYNYLSKNIIDFNKLDGGILTKEVTYDNLGLREHYRNLLINNKNIEIVTSCEVNQLKKNKNSFLLYTKKTIEEFDVVINCSYTNLNKFNRSLKLNGQKFLYEYTCIPIIKSNKLASIGLTIMDGPYFTLLPFGKTDNFLLYDVELSVLNAYQGKKEKLNWQNEWSLYLKNNKNQIYKKFINKIRDLLPCINEFELQSFLHGPRVVLADKNRTDQRRTSVNMPTKNYFNVFGGKVDHIFFAFKEIEKHLFK